MPNRAENKMLSILSNESAIATVLLPQTNLDYSVLIDTFFCFCINIYITIL